MVDKKPSLKAFPVTGTVAEAISAFYDGCVELRDEVREQYDNMPESMQGGDRGSALDEAADALDAFCDEAPEPSTDLGDELRASWTENRRKGTSRRVRLENLVAAGQAAIEALQEYQDGLAEDDESDTGADAADLISTLEDHVGQAEGVDL